MQIDFHHTVTYVVARLAGFDHPSADIVSYAAQYVDDSVTTGFLQFDNGMRYQRHATAHPVYDPGNVTDNDKDSVSWLPYHFLPGNCGKDEGATVTDPYEKRLICRPDSYVVRAMMAAAIRSKNQPWGLHRLGISAHVFVDTFAHQDFIGLNHPLNEVGDSIQDERGEKLAHMPLPPMGHGQVNTYPDRPYLKWSYKKPQTERFGRDNTELFIQAVTRLHEEFKRYLAGDSEAIVEPISANATVLIRDRFETLDHEDENTRHEAWLKAIRDNAFGFGAVELSYQGTGEGSWKHQALGDNYVNWFKRESEKVAEVVKDRIESAADLVGVDISEHYPFTNNFLVSNYKKFHDAARWHSHEIFCDILPRFGIYAA